MKVFPANKKGASARRPFLFAGGALIGALVVMLSLWSGPRPAAWSVAQGRPSTAEVAAPAEATRLIEQATAAINQHKPDTLTPLITAGAVFAWAQRTHITWGGDVLVVPASDARDGMGEEARCLAIFHTWHPC